MQNRKIMTLSIIFAQRYSLPQMSNKSFFEYSLNMCCLELGLLLLLILSLTFALPNHLPRPIALVFTHTEYPQSHTYISSR